MQRIILILVLAALGWYGWGKYEAHVKADRAAARTSAGKSLPATSSNGDQALSFVTCDGRTTCLQMTSCEEAKFFVRNCPGMNPQGTRETASCEQQWCR